MDDRLKLKSKGNINETRDDGSTREFYESDIYHVEAIRHQGDIRQILIRRHDWQPVFDWRDKQEIKNQLVGAESEAIEVYPAESRVVDNQNWTHLWLQPGGKSFPYGYPKGERTTYADDGTQRESGKRSDDSPLINVPIIECRLNEPETADECFQLQIGDQVHNLHAWQLIQVTEAVNHAWLGWISWSVPYITRRHLELDGREKLLTSIWERQKALG